MTPKDIDFAQKLADAAGEAIRPFFRAKFDQESKGDSTPVTEADRAAEAAMRTIIDQPIGRERWLGVVGRPTLFNGKPAKSSRCRELKDAVLATTSPHLFDEHDAEHFMGLASKVASRKIIYGGDCYNYGLVASGHVDVVCEAGLKLHDFAALEPLHAESGGHVLAIGDQARVDDVLEAIACHH